MPERRQRGQFLKAPDAPALQGFQQFGRVGDSSASGSVRQEFGLRRRTESCSTPANPRAAQMAASGLAASARLAFTPISAARRAMAAATSCGSPKSRSRPGSVESNGIARGLLHRRREFEGQRGQIAVAVKTGEHVFLRWVDVARTSNAAQQPGDGARAGPVDALARAFQHQGGAGLGVGLPRHRNQHGGRMFHGAAQAEPGSQRDAARGGGRRIAQIHGHQSEPAALDQQIGGFEGVLGVVPAAHPKQAVQAHAGGGGGSGDRRHLRHPPARRLPGARWLRPEWKPAGWCGRKKRARKFPSGIRGAVRR